jgi:hypothetical protein
MDKDQKRSSNECYTPSSEPFRMYLYVLANLISHLEREVSEPHFSFTIAFGFPSLTFEILVPY